MEVIKKLVGFVAVTAVVILNCLAVVWWTIAAFDLAERLGASPLLSLGVGTVIGVWIAVFLVPRASVLLDRIEEWVDSDE